MLGHPRAAMCAIAISLLAIAGCGTSADSSSQAAPPTVTVTATPSPTPTPSPTNANKPKPKPAAAGDTWVMPNEVGKVLQDAQDDIQALTGNPFFFTASEDATGASRFQMLDRDWQVCSQKPGPGSHFNEDTDITFYVVKLSEHCP